MLLQTALIDSVVAFLLGAFFFYIRKDRVAKWTWVIGSIGILVLLLTKGVHPFGWEELRQNPNWFVVAVTSVRAIGYSYGAICCDVYLKSKGPTALDTPAQPADQA